MLLTAASDWAKYIGHFHPVVVHLPIGILIVAFILELVSWKRPHVASLDFAIEICLLTGFVSAVLSCFLGWFLSFEGGYDESTLLLHQYMGMGVAVLAGVCLMVRKKRILLIILVLLITVTGHFGGNMTHGEDYLTAGMPAPVSSWLGISVKSDTGLAVPPVLKEKCFSCHSAKKVKGGLRMDTEELLFKGGKHGPVIRRGNANGSELIARLLLPANDDKRMPPKDQPQLTKEEISLLQGWIQAGADTKRKWKADTAVLQRPGRQEPLSTVFNQNPPAARQQDIDALTSLGVLVAPVAKDKNLLEVSCINYPAFDNSKMALLMKLAGNIAWLRLDNTQITNDALMQPGQFKNLVRLNLAGTNVSSAGVEKLQQLLHLEYLNIINTKTDDAGLNALASIKSLKSIYCWNSAITQKGIDNFKARKPSVELISGSVKQ